MTAPNFIEDNLPGFLALNPDWTEAEAREELADIDRTNSGGVWVTEDEAKQILSSPEVERMLRRVITG